ncbi:MAG: 1,2-phenylacetyl-CoA epoxidase subunit PaaE [Chitinophagaceae bacterium]
MDTNFYSLKVASIKNETPSCVCISFEVPTDLKQKFTFTQGQYLTLKANINNKEERRSYSICSSTFEDSLCVAIKQVEGGVFSTWANTVLKVGDTLESMIPNGKFFTPLQKENNKKYVAFAAGSGITPIISIIKTTLITEPKSVFTLIYSNKNIANIIFKEDLEALKNKYPNRFQVVYILSRQSADAPLNFGRINDEKLLQLSRIINWKLVDEYFICGPEEMIFCVKDYLLNQKVDKNHIHFELFTSSKSAAKKITPTSSVEQSAVSIKKDGRTSVVYINPSQPTNILDAALQQGGDLPYACKGGVCCTCKAKLIKGEVSMDVHWGLEEFEIEQGFILTCQSYPTTNEVEVDFDF